MATNAAEFLITLNNQVSGPAAAAGGSLQQLEGAAKGLTDVLGNTSAGAAAIGIRMAGVGDQLRDSSGRFIAAGDAAGQAAAKMKQVQEAADKARGPTRDFGDSIADLGNNLFTLPGPLGAVQDAISKLGPEGQAVATAIGIATAAFTIFAAACIGGMAAAISITETLTRMRAQFDALAGSAAAGGKVNEMVQRLGQSLPFATAQVGAWAKSLLAAGLEGQRLENAVRAVAAASALMGAEGGSAAESLFKKLAEGGQQATKLIQDFQKGGRKSATALAEMGLRSHDVAAALGMTDAQFKKAKISAAQMGDAVAKALAAKGAGPLATAMNAFPNIIGKAKEGFMSLFSGMQPQVEKFMASVAKLFSAFNKGGFAIQILKPIITSVFGTLFTWASKALDMAYAGFIRVAIWGVKAYIMAHPLVGAFRELWVAVVKLGTALGIVGGKSQSLGILAFVGKVISMTFGTIIMVIKGVVGAITFVVNIVTRVVAAIRGAMAGIGGAGKGAGGNLVSGLIAGIMGGAGAVIAAVKGLAAGALAAFTGAFGIRSPSAVMRKHGDDNIAGGTAIGVKEGSPKVDAAMAKLGGKPGGAGAKGRGGKGGGDTFDFRGAHFGGDLTEEKMEGWLIRILEKARRGGSEMEPA